MAAPNLYVQVSGALVSPGEQRFVAYRWQREPEVIALYFGASWCAPCHALTPELLRIRNALRDAGADTEVVYISLDESDSEARRDMLAQHMPWPAVAPRRLRSLPAVRSVGGLATPNIVLINRSGEVLASGWAGRRYDGVKAVLQRWVELSGGKHAR